MIITNLLFILCPIIGYGYAHPIFMNGISDEPPVVVNGSTFEPPIVTNGSTFEPPLFINGRPRGGFLGSLYVEDPNIKDLPTYWFGQKLNHFDDGDTRYWKQRCYINRAYFATGGPVFFFIGGESELTSYWLLRGTMVEYASVNRAMMVGLEHRYYGKSHPTSDASTANLRYLTSEQALADLADFRQAIARMYKLTSKNKWITFGGSYPGALSAWFRYKYPHLVHGAVASSAPIYAEVDFSQYLEVCSAALQADGTYACESNVQQASAVLDQYLQSDSGRAYLSSLFKTCNPLTGNKDDLAAFAQGIAGNFMGVIQYNQDNSASKPGQNSRVNIQYLCSIMNNAQYGDPLHRYATVNYVILKKGGQKCMGTSFQGFVNYMKQTAWTAGNNAGGGRQWTYQTCTEFGFYQTTDSRKQVFGSSIPLSHYIKACTLIFGNVFNYNEVARGANWSNRNYGGFNMVKGASRIVFPNGSIDPWHALSFLRSVGNILAVYINGTSHCANMQPTSSYDSPALRSAKYKIGAIVKQWLTEE